MLTTLSYAFGGRIQEETADGVDVTIDNPGTIAALEYLQSMRWEDNSMGSNLLLELAARSTRPSPPGKSACTWAAPTSTTASSPRTESIRRPTA